MTLRFVNAGFDGTANVYVNSVLKTRAEAHDSGYTAYLQASSVPQTVAVRTSGGLVLASAKITFAIDTQYTVVYRSIYSNSDGLLALPDTVSAPALVPDTIPSASFRLVQVAFGDIGAPVDVYRTNGSADLTDLTPVASNVLGETASPYVSFPAGPTRILVTLYGDHSRVVYDSGIRTVSAGEAWTMVLMEGNGLTSGLWMKDRS